MRPVTKRHAEQARHQGYATLERTRIKVDSSCEFYDGVVVDAIYYNSETYGVGLNKPVRFDSPEQAESFKKELVQLICRHTGGTVK